MVLSHDMLEAYAICFLDSFSRRCHLGEFNSSRRKYARPTPIERFAEQYLGLDLICTRLSEVGNVLGLTAYVDTEYSYTEGGEVKTVPLLKIRFFWTLASLRAALVIPIADAEDLLLPMSAPTTSSFAWRAPRTKMPAGECIPWVSHFQCGTSRPVRIGMNGKPTLLPPRS